MSEPGNGFAGGGVKPGMTPPRRSALAAGAVALLLLAGCTGDPPPPPTPGGPTTGAAPAYRLVAFDSCDDVLAGLKRAAKAAVTPWGFAARAFGNPGGRGPEPAAAAREGLAKEAPGEPAFSGTNVHEAGVDEPDLVKTDGRRIVTVTAGVLRVVDTATKAVTGAVELASTGDSPYGLGDVSLLTHGDRALVFIPQWSPVERPVGIAFAPVGSVRTRVVLVDLAGARPAVLGSYAIDGSLVDARQVGSLARVVVRSSPRIVFPSENDATDERRLAANRAVIDRSTLADWLPRYEVEARGETRRGSVDCGSVSRPESFSGTSMLTVLSFDIASSASGAELFGSGDPTTIVADGDLVYSNGTSLYVATDQRWRPVRGDATTEIHRFDAAKPGPPRYVAAGRVPGTLINQYAMSEFDGHLRVATTATAGRGSTSSSVHVLRVSDMAPVGVVGGLGKGEQIYSVRFIGPTGYVVTFRQTDPLYVVDITDPTSPAVRGELKINGYSAYLHPVDSGRLLGVGQDADDRGRVKGTQISLFDVADATRPTRVAQHHIPSGWSESEFDPHAFLYWPPTGLLVVPLSSPYRSGALALRVSGSEITEAGTVTHPTDASGGRGGHMPIRRSLIAANTLWTLSDTGLRATDPTTLANLAWLPW